MADRKRIKFPGFKILDGYITRKFLGTYVFAIALIIVIVVVFDAVEKMDDFITTKASLKAVALDYYLNFIPYFINYLSGLAIEHFDAKPALRRFFLLVALIGSLGMLFYFKYANFVLRSVNALLGTAFAEIQGIGTLPLGISFYTFQTLSYSIDVYRRDVKAERNIVDFGAYVVMFPQLIAGPIVKYRDVSNQLHVYKHRYTLSQIEEGMTLFTFGLAKKVLLADAVGALWTDIIGVADSPSTTFVGLANASTPLVWLGIIAYSLQLYFDFSGYSMMGIGMGKMLGFDFPANFNYPYISASITEFWRRWHMTLSGWFREYVYIPLGGNRKGLKRQILNLFIVELLTGIWHGANWNFICWGLYYFVLLAIEKLFLLPHLKKGKVWPHIYTLFLVVVGWAMFVGNDTGVSFGLLFQKLFIPSGGVSPLYFLRNYGVLLAVSVVYTSLFEAAEVDGATSSQVFWQITLPLLRPILVYVVITSLIGGLQLFDVPQILTNGTGDPMRSTMTLIMFLNKHLYSKNYGMAGALSVVLFIITGILSLVVFKITGNDKRKG